MRAMSVVMLDELGQHRLQVPPAKDKDATEAFPTKGSRSSSRRRHWPGSPNRGRDHPDVLGTEDLVEDDENLQSRSRIKNWTMDGGWPR